MKKSEGPSYEILFLLIFSSLVMSDGLFEWTQKPKINIEFIHGQNASLQWDYKIPHGEAFDFLLISRYRDAMRSYARETMATKMADGRVKIYEKFKTRIDLTGAATLRMNNVKMSDETIYCCEVHYSSKSAMSCVQAFVLVPPKITHYPKNKTVREDTITSLHCNATGIPMPRIEWYRMRSPYLRIHTGTTLDLLMTRNDSGAFVCRASNRIGVSNGSAYIDVQYPPKAIVSVNRIITNQSDVIKVNCHVTGNPKPSIKWTKMENLSQVLSLENTLALNVTGKIDEGRYQCQAKNGVGNSSHDVATVLVQNYSPIDPIIETCPMNSQVTENQAFVMQCSSIASPSSTYRIYHNQRLIKENRSGYHKICRAKKSHSGNYTCVPMNGYGAGKSVSIRLDVQYPPTVIVHPKTINMKEGAIVSLTCVATGNPYPNIIWKKEGTAEILGTSNVLVINGTHRSHTGNYTCRAYNGIGSSVTNTSRLEIFYAPEIFIPPINITILESLNTSLYCEAVGNPEPKIAWVKQENGILRSLNTSQERLKFVNISRRDVGVYFCTASNVIGNVRSAAKVNVLYKPSNTKLISSASQDTVKTKTSVNMYCQTDANPPADLYQFYYGDDLIAITNNGAHHLIAVEKKHEGVYHCMATNTLGVGDTAYMFLRVKVPASVVVYPKSQTLNEGDTLLLTCAPNGDPLPNITWTMWNGTEVISNDPVLFINHITRINDGAYVCTASNGVGKNATGMARVRVTYEPNITIARTIYRAEDSRNIIQLSCIAIGYPLPVIVWSPLPENSTVINRVFSKTTSVSTVVFEIAKTLKNAGVVQCFASNSKGNVFENVTLLSDSEKGFRERDRSKSTWFGLSPLAVLAIMTGFMTVFIAAAVMASMYRQRRCGKVVFQKR